MGGKRSIVPVERIKTRVLLVPEAKVMLNTHLGKFLLQLVLAQVDCIVCKPGPRAFSIGGASC